MNSPYPAEPHTVLRPPLTDRDVIAATAAQLRAEGRGELGIWRHFLDRFVVDLDALSLIMDELFGDGDEGEALDYREAA